MRSLRRAILIALWGASLAAASLPALAQPAFFFEGDMVRGAPPEGVKAPVCVLSSQFRHGDQVVWRIRVLDPATGREMDDKGLKSVQVRLADGESFAARYGAHPPKGAATDHFWSAAWKIPTDFPTGSLSYTVTATGADGRSATWQPFKMAPSQFTVVP